MGGVDEQSATPEPRLSRGRGGWRPGSGRPREEMSRRGRREETRRSMEGDEQAATPEPGLSRGRGRGRARVVRAVKKDQGVAGNAAGHPPAAKAGEGKGASQEEAPRTMEDRLRDWEERLWKEGFDVVAGTDEAGRGPLAGPVVAGAFAVLSKDDIEVRDLLSTVADSKAMNASQRETAFQQLTDPKFNGRFVWAVGEASVSEIDETNILRAALIAMSRAVQSLSVRPDCVLVDGCNRPPELLKPGECWTRGTKEERQKAEEIKQMPKLSRWFAAAKKPAEPAANDNESEIPSKTAPDATETWLPRQVEAVIEGDAKVPCISAASVLAKVHRDRLMDALHERYPEYGFATHRGYGTEDHMRALKAHGPCPEHRRSFGPVREALGLDTTSSEQSPGQQALSWKGVPSPTSSAAAGTQADKNLSEVCSTPPPHKRGASTGVLGSSVLAVGSVNPSELDASETPAKKLRSSTPRAKGKPKGGKKEN